MPSATKSKPADQPINASGSAEVGTTEQELKSPLSPSVTVIPRLISVVEIIKREYIKLLQEKHSTRLHGLHQYNEIGNVESDQPEAQAEVDRDAAIAQALDGKH
jgi:hypothetical protein